jgi:hydrogenase small subunit
MKVDRRDFLKLAGVSALLSALSLGSNLKAETVTRILSSVDWNRAQAAISQAVKGGDLGIIWFEAQDCAGNTTAVIQATDPSLADVLLGTTPLIGPGTIRLLFHETVMPEWGTAQVPASSYVNDPDYLAKAYSQAIEPATAIGILEEAAKGSLGGYVLVLEGSFPQEAVVPGSNIPQGSGGYYCLIGPYTCTEWLKKLMANAVAVVAVGNCASYGGLVANKVLQPPPNFQYATWSQSPTGAIGFFDDPVRGIKGAVHQDYFSPENQPFQAYLDQDKVPDFKTSKPAIAVPGCPANGNGILRTLGVLALVALGVLPPEILQRSVFLDAYARPLFIFGNTVHDQCPRAGFYAAGSFRSTPGETNAKCLFEVGCKGPISNCPWNKYGWVSGVGGPTRTGGVCIGCTMPGFTDATEPFWVPLNAPRLPPVSTTAVALGAAAVAGAVAAYAVDRKIKSDAKKAMSSVEGAKQGK